jgi:hypothetical protein
MEGATVLAACTKTVVFDAGLSALRVSENRIWRKFIFLHKVGRIRGARSRPQAPRAHPRGCFATGADEIDTPGT